jgi:hypothetical protein
MPVVERFPTYRWRQLRGQGQLPALPAQTIVLDLAAGAGDLLEDIRRTDPGVQGYGLESSPLQAAAAQAQGLPVLVGEPGYRVDVEKDAAGLIVLPALSRTQEYHDWLLWAWHHLKIGGTLLAWVSSPKLPAFFAASRGFEWRGLDGYDGARYCSTVALSRLPRRTVASGWHTRVDALAAAPWPVSALRQMSQQAGFPGRIDAWDQCRCPIHPTPLDPFMSKWRSAAELEQMLAASSYAADQLAQTLPAPGRLSELPPLPLKPGHLALQLVTGAFDGPVGEGEHRHVVRGRVVRTPVVTEELGEEGPVTVTADRLTLEITTVDATGALRRFGSQAAEEVP